jgi:hypothetical protein
MAGHDSSEMPLCTRMGSVSLNSRISEMLGLANADETPQRALGPVVQSYRSSIEAGAIFDALSSLQEAVAALFLGVQCKFGRSVVVNRTTR